MARVIHLSLLLATIPLSKPSPPGIPPTTMHPDATPTNASQMDTSPPNEVDLQFYPQNKSWIDALKRCHRDESYLVEITNFTVQQAVIKLLNEKEDINKGVWIGLERPIFGINPRWTWVSGKGDEESVIQRNSTVDPLNHHCGKIIQVITDFMWVDADCHDELPFICQSSSHLP